MTINDYMPENGDMQIYLIKGLKGI